MGPLRIDRQPDGLRAPTLVTAFEGWNDAGEAASGALEALADEVGATVFGEIDPEEFFDFQVNRPIIRWDGDERVLDWPELTLSCARLDGPHDVVFLLGHEPNLRWRTFTETILGLATDLGAGRLVTLGSLQVDVPHTRPVSMTGSASDASVAERHGLRRSTYEGPTGIVGVLHQAASAAGLEAVSLWAGVPHYLAGTAYLAASLALARRAGGLLGLEPELPELEAEAANQQADIAELVADDSDLAEYVEELQRRADAEPDPLEGHALPSQMVSGDELAAEFERYLRDRPAD